MTQPIFCTISKYNFAIWQSIAVDSTEKRAFLVKILYSLDLLQSKCWELSKFMADREGCSLNIILFGEPKGLFFVKDLLKSNTKVKKVSIFEYFSLAREYLEHHNVDMVILDVDDDTTSWQYLTEEFGMINRQTKIVLLSCNTNDAVRAYEAGVFDYLLKPMKKEQLERVVAKAGLNK